MFNIESLGYSSPDKRENIIINLSIDELDQRFERTL